jgi:phage tail P2-like protein
MTTEVYKRWYIDNKPASGLLPGINGGYTDNEISQWLMAPFDRTLVEIRDKIDDYPRQLNPLTCDPIILDFLAPMFGFTDQYWSTTWNVNTKRSLLNNAFSLIWPKKGTSLVLSFVLNAFDIKHIIQEGQSFIVGRNVVGDPLGTISWDYKIILPYEYYATPKEVLTKKLDYLFGPCWCSKEVVYSSDFFITYEVLGFLNQDNFVLLSSDHTDAFTV